MSQTDRELIADCRSGDTQAFARLVERHQDRLYNGLLHVLGSHEDARDAAQDGFLLAFEKLNQFQGHSAFYSWLFRIALNAGISRKRKEKNRPGSIDALKDQTGQEPQDLHPGSTPSYGIEQSERQRVVQRALADLPEEYRVVLVLKEMESLSYEQIGEIVGCPIGTVRSRIHRARTELREKLSRLLRDDPI